MNVDTKTGATTPSEAKQTAQPPTPEEAFGSGVAPDPATAEQFDDTDHSPGSGESSLPEPTKLPWVQLAYGSVGFSVGTDFRAGDLVLGKEVAIAGPKTTKDGAATTVDVIVLRCVTFWKEYVNSEKYKALEASGERAKSFDTEDQAIAAGFTTRYDPATRTPPSCPPAMNWDLLVKKPEGMAPSDVFFLNVGNDWWAPARMIVDKANCRNIETLFSRGARYAEQIGKPYGNRQAVWTLGTECKATSRTATARPQWMLTCKFRSIMPQSEFESLYAQFLGEAGLDKLRKSLHAHTELGAGAGPKALPQGEAVVAPAATQA